MAEDKTFRDGMPAIDVHRVDCKENLHKKKMCPCSSDSLLTFLTIWSTNSLEKKMKATDF